MHRDIDAKGIFYIIVFGIFILIAVIFRRKN